jgi:hypothetical protein
MKASVLFYPPPRMNGGKRISVGICPCKLLVISKCVLSTKFIASPEIAILSFHELRKNNFFNMSDSKINSPL